MTKTELIAAVSKKTDFLKKDVDQVVNTTIDTIVAYLGEEAKKSEEKRDNLKIRGFGKFEVRDRNERKGRNPQTGEEVTIPERKVPFFKAGKTFKEKIEK
ncbi:MAG: HU family DNA-binding protein [bacterium]